MRYYLSHIFIFLSVVSFAQTSVYENELKLKGGFGTLLPHRAIMKHLHTGHAKAFEISYNFNTYGNKTFHSDFNYPQLGLAFGIYDVGNPEDVGFTYAFTPTASIPFTRNKYFPQFKIGIGVGYVSKPFGYNGNYRNVAIGSHLNAAVLLELEKTVQLSERLKLYYSFSMMHYSNGASTLPNLGLNTLTLNTGISYALGEKKDIILRDKIDFDKSLHFTPYLFGGWRENTIHKPRKYGVGILSLEFSKQVNRKGKWLFGADFGYNSSVEHFDEIEDIEPLSSKDNFQSGLFTGYALALNKIELVVDLGMYTVNAYKTRGMFYQRIALRKQFGEKIIANVGLKSHNAVAEYLEIGIGYKIK